MIFSGMIATREWDSVFGLVSLCSQSNFSMNQVYLLQVKSVENEGCKQAVIQGKYEVAFAQDIPCCISVGAGGQQQWQLESGGVCRIWDIEYDCCSHRM
ncbi:hypothetical protein Nepgr_014381 [Nepenthes gracilis]|uniref:Uncharacterized protein n=1 Tax=Nepenthes gracilis TaxID=150966 RepID=A0AAD3XQE7_NEPGR|nr:hypothetical protein Nepgr_014381 [Nepenthes gracilis]